MAYKQQKFITLSSGGWESDIKGSAWAGEALFCVTDSSLYPHIMERARDLSGGSLKGPDPIHEGSTLMT